MFTFKDGLYVPHTWIKKRKRYTAFDFFAGCGGFGLGLLQAGSAGCIKSRGGTVAKKAAKPKKKQVKVPDSQIEQNVLF